MRNKDYHIYFLLLILFFYPDAYGFASKIPADEDEMKIKIDSLLHEDSLHRLSEVKNNLKRATEFLNYLGLDSAISYAQRITAYDVNMVPAEIIAEAYYIIGKSNRILGNNDLALKNYWITIQKLRYVNGFGCRSEVNQELGHMYYQLGHLIKAVDKFEDAYWIEVERNDIYKQIELLKIIVVLYRETDNLSQSVQFQKKLMRLYTLHDNQKAFQLMKELSNDYIQLDSFQAAVNLQIQIFEHERKKGNLKGQFQSLLEQLKIFYAIPDFDQFLNRGVQQFNVLYKRQNKKTLTPEILEIKAKELMYFGHFYKFWADLNPPEDYYNAIIYYDSALRIFNKIEQEEQVISTQLSLAEVFFNLENFRGCIDYCEATLDKLTEKRDYHVLLKTYDLLARSYQELDRYKLAYQAREKYLAYKDTIHYQQYTALNEILVSETEEKEKLVFQNLEQFLQQELDTLNEALLRLDIENYRRKNELLITETSLKNAIIDNQQLKQQQDSQAFELYRQRLTSEMNENQISMLQSEMKKRELELKNKQQEQALRDQQIEVLEQEKKLKEAELQKSEAQRIILILSITISMIILIFVIFGYYNIKRSKEKIASKNKLIEVNNQKLKELNEEKNRLIRIVAHDLKNPLTSALSLAEMLKSRFTLLSREETQSLSLIRRSLRRMYDMVNKILDIKAIDAENLNIEFEAVNVQQVLNYLIELFRNKAEKKHIQLHSDLEEVYAMVDRNYFIQIIENLLSNALKFSDKGKSIHIQAMNFEDKCRIMITDHGPGFSQLDLSNLFKENQLLSAQPTDGESSNGLGLSIVKKFVDIMGGRVWCESKIGQGATFIVEFEKALIPV
jgi:signal transduction histidine kinase